MNGYVKYIVPIIIILSILFAAGYTIRINTVNIQGIDNELQEQVIKKELDKRVSLVEKDLDYIKTGIDEIKERLK